MAAWFRCVGYSVGPFGNTPARSTSEAHLQSVAFQPRLGSEPRAQLPKVLQRVCCEWVGCRILPCCRVQMPQFLRIFGCAMLAAYTVAPRQSNILVHGRSIFGDISVPCGTLICEKPLQLQTSLHCSGSSHLSLRLLYLQIV